MLSPTISSVLLSSNSNFAVWEKFIKSRLHEFSEVGKGIINKIPFVVKYPMESDMLLLPDGSPGPYSMYSRIDEHVDPSGILVPAALTPAGLDSFRRDCKQGYPDQVRQSDLLNNKVAVFLTEHMSQDVLSEMQKSPAFRAAYDRVPSCDAYAMFYDVVSHFGIGTRRSKILALQKFLSLKQGVSSFAKFVDQIKDGEDASINNYSFSCSTCNHPPSISVHDLVESVFFGGLNADAFRYKLELEYAKPLVSPKPLIWDVILNEFGSYNREMNLDHVSVIKPSALVVALPPSSLCANCHVPFVPGVSASGFPHLHCLVCHRAKMAVKRAVVPGTVPGPIVKPPSAKELAKARALISVHDLLASPPAVIASPDPGQQKLIDALLKLQASPKALVAVNFDTVPLVHHEFSGFVGCFLPGLVAFSSVPLNKFYFDSCCSFTIVCDLELLEDNSMVIPVPIIVGGLAGSSVEAKRVGFLKGWPAPYNIAYYCPHAGVSLYSIGSFVHAGGTSIQADMSLTLLTASGDVLCTVAQCPRTNIVSVPLSLRLVPPAVPVPASASSLVTPSALVASTLVPSEVILPCVGTIPDLSFGSFDSLVTDVPLPLSSAVSVDSVDVDASDVLPVLCFGSFDSLSSLSCDVLVDHVVSLLDPLSVLDPPASSSVVDFTFSRSYLRKLKKRKLKMAKILQTLSTAELADVAIGVLSASLPLSVSAPLCAGLPAGPPQLKHALEKLSISELADVAIGVLRDSLPSSVLLSPCAGLTADSNQLKHALEKLSTAELADVAIGVLRASLPSSVLVPPCAGLTAGSTLLENASVVLDASVSVLDCPDASVSVFDGKDFEALALVSFDAIDLHAASVSIDDVDFDVADLDEVSLVSASMPSLQDHSLTRQRLKVLDMVNALHDSTGHPSDQVLCSMCDHGLYPGFTSKDVRDNRMLRGRCAHCLAGKHKRKQPSSSTSPLPASVGHVISMDLKQLPVPTPQGNTHQSILVDGLTGYMVVVLHKSKKAPVVFANVKVALQQHFNRYGHQVKTIHTDSEVVYVACSSMFNSLGINTVFSPPDMHAQRVERYIQTMQNKMAAVVSGMDFCLPPKYQVYVAKEVVFHMNTQPNTLTFPVTPYMMVTGCKSKLHPSYPHLKIGTRCMVNMTIEKNIKNNLDAFGKSFSSNLKMETILTRRIRINKLLRRSKTRHGWSQLASF